MSAFESSVYRLWSAASLATYDEPLCRARWGEVMAALERMRDAGTPNWQDFEDLDTLWRVAVMHRYDYSKTPPGYIGRGAR
jgi:hypothetical protein